MNTNTVCLAVCLAAAGTSAAQQLVPLRQLGPAEATSAAPVGFQVVARGLQDGRVMVVNFIPGQLLMLDRALATSTLALDSNALSPGVVGRRQLTFMPYVADSLLLIDTQARTLLVVDPNGKVAHVMAPPRTDDVTWMSAGGLVRLMGGADASGHLYYRGFFRPPPMVFTPGGPMPAPPGVPDSFPIIRADLETRKLDTVAAVQAPLGMKIVILRSADNVLSSKTIRNPLPVSDDWAVLSDGTVAIVRGHDYHIDWIYPDGTKTSSPKMPFDWRRISDEEKQHVIDSAKALEARSRHMMDSVYAARGMKPPAAPNYEYVDPKELPDYYPPLRASLPNLIPDRDANLWILPSTSAQSTTGLVYDVVNRKGELFERVQLPATCALAGFGPGGDVYVNCTNAGGRGLQRRRVVK